MIEPHRRFFSSTTLASSLLPASASSSHSSARSPPPATSAPEPAWSNRPSPYATTSTSRCARCRSISTAETSCCGSTQRSSNSSSPPAPAGYRRWRRWSAKPSSSNPTPASTPSSSTSTKSLGPFQQTVILSEGTHGIIVRAAAEEPALSLSKGPAVVFVFAAACFLNTIKQTRHFDRSGPQFHRGPRSGEICFSTTPVLSPQSALFLLLSV